MTPFFFGIRRFEFAVILSIIAAMLITVGKRPVTCAPPAIVGWRRRSVASAIPVRVTRVSGRFVVAAAGVVMLVIALARKAGALVVAIPEPVLARVALAVFVIVAVVGVHTLSRVDFNDSRNVVTVAVSVGLAIPATVQPEIAETLPGWAHPVRLRYRAGWTS